MDLPATRGRPARTSSAIWGIIGTGRRFTSPLDSFMPFFFFYNFFVATFRPQSRPWPRVLLFSPVRFITRTFAVRRSWPRRASASAHFCLNKGNCNYKYNRPGIIFKRGPLCCPFSSYREHCLIWFNFWQQTLTTPLWASFFFRFIYFRPFFRWTGFDCWNLRCTVGFYSSYWTHFVFSSYFLMFYFCKYKSSSSSLRKAQYEKSFPSVIPCACNIAFNLLSFFSRLFAARFEDFSVRGGL